MNLNLSVVGTVFVDCKGFTAKAYDPAGRNIGKVKFFHGGVGRNVAETLASLGLPVSFVSTIDDSGIGREVAAHLADLEINVDDVLALPEDGMGYWLAVLDEKGELAGSVSQMPDLDKLERLLASEGQRILARSSHIALEVDLTAEISRRVLSLAKVERKPVYIIPGNLSVLSENLDFLTAATGLICNDIEAEKLMQTSLDRSDKSAILKQAKQFADFYQLPSLVITLGAEGSIYYSKSESGYQPAMPVSVVDSTGAGDAFFSGTVMGLVTGHSLKNAVLIGTKVASWTIESAENTCRDLAKRLGEDQLLGDLLNKGTL